MSANRERAIRSVKDFQGSFETRYPRFRGWLKAVSGSVHVSGRDGYVYVQRRDVGAAVQLEQIRMTDPNVPDIDGFPVIVGRNDIWRGEDVVLGRDTATENSWVYDYVMQSHHEQHEAPSGWDIVYIQGRAIVPLRVGPQLTADMTLKIDAGVYPTLTGNHWFVGTSSYNLTASVPTPAWGQKWVLVGIDQRDGTIMAHSGDIVPPHTSLSWSHLPDAPFDMVTLAAIQLYAGQTTIAETNIWDLRAIAGWAGSLDVFEDGILEVDNATAINFTGDGVSVEICGHIANVIIPGGAFTADADIIILPHLAGSTYNNVEDWFIHTQSAGLVSGGAVTDAGGGTINVAKGTGFIKSIDDNIGPTYYFDWPAAPGLAPGNNRKSWVYVDYAVGVPVVKVTDTQANIDRNTTFTIGELWRDGVTLHILSTGQNAYNLSMRTSRNLTEEFNFRRGSGITVSESGAARTVDVSQGFMYRGLNEIPQAHIDTDPGGAADTFVAFYRDGVGGWTEVAAQAAISNTQYDDGTGALTNLTGTRYGVFWVYLDFDNHLYIQYGQGNYRLAEALAAEVPDTTPFLDEFALLIARVLVQRNAANFYSVSFPWDVLFSFAAAADHGNLGGLLDNDHTFYASIRYVSMIRGGVLTEYADPDDAFTAADTAGDIIFVPPGTWTLTAAHTLAAGVSVYGLGPNSECCLQCTAALGTLITIPNDSTCGIYSCKINYAATDNGAILTALRVNGLGQCKRCVARVANAGTGGAVAIHVAAATVYDDIAHAEGAGGIVNGFYFNAGSIVRGTAFAQLTAAGTRACGIESVSGAGNVFHTAGIGFGANAPRYGWYSAAGTIIAGILGRYSGTDADIYVANGTLTAYALYYDSVAGAGVLEPGTGDRLGIATDITKTVKAAGGDFTTIEAALAWFTDSKTLTGACKIDCDAGTYTIAAALTMEDVRMAAGASLEIEGDQRELAGLTYVEQSNGNQQGLANGGTGAVTLSNAGNNVTVACGGGNPDFNADGWVNGDKVLIFNNAGGVAEYTVNAINPGGAGVHVIQLTVAAPAIGADGTAVCLLPNRRIVRSNAGPCITLDGPQVNAEIDGFYILTNTGASCNGIEVRNQAKLTVGRVTIDAEDFCLYGQNNAIITVDSSFHGLTFWEGSYGAILSAAVNGSFAYSVGVNQANSHVVAEGFSNAGVLYGIATSVNWRAYWSKSFSNIAATTATVRGTTAVGFYASQMSYIEASNTVALLGGGVALGHDPNPSCAIGNCNSTIQFS